MNPALLALAALGGGFYLYNKRQEEKKAKNKKRAAGTCVPVQAYDLELLCDANGHCQGIQVRTDIPAQALGALEEARRSDWEARLKAVIGDKPINSFSAPEARAAIVAALNAHLSGMFPTCNWSTQPPMPRDMPFPYGTPRPSPTIETFIVDNLERFSTPLNNPGYGGYPGSYFRGATRRHGWGG